MQTQIEQNQEFALLKEMIKNTPDQIFVGSAQGVFLDVYPGAERTYHLDYSKMIGKHYSELYSVQFSARISEVLNQVLSTNTTQIVTYPIKVADMDSFCELDVLEQEFWYEARVIPIHVDYSDEPLVLWWTRDITERVVLQKRVQKIIDYDELTDLYTRRKILSTLTEQFHLSQAQSRNTAVIMIDIDNFKSYNDTYGHLIGDKVISHVTRVFADTVRDGDYLGRLGGEEFIAILPDTNREQAVAMAEALRNNVADMECWLDEKQSAHVTISLGVSHFYLADSDETQALQRADEAMYLSKQRGRNITTLFE